MPAIIGLHGPQGSGKSTIARAIVWERRGEAVRMSFATPLKRMLDAYLTTLGVERERTDAMINGSAKEVPAVEFGGQTPRHAMRTLGTEWGRNYVSTSIWTDAMALRIARRDARIVVIDDVRFMDEYEFIAAAGGMVFRVQRDGTDFSAAHASDMPLPIPLPVLSNDSTPEAAARMALALAGL